MVRKERSRSARNQLRELGKTSLPLSSSAISCPPFSSPVPTASRLSSHSLSAYFIALVRSEQRRLQRCSLIPMQALPPPPFPHDCALKVGIAEISEVQRFIAASEHRGEEG